jgi:hypothetical protein
MQKHFYVPPEYDNVAIKRNVFKDMGCKLKSWKHDFKHGLNIQPSNTPMTVKARVEELMLSTYNSTNVDILLKKLCSEKNQVSHKLY